MDSETRDLLEKTLSLTEDNNKLLRKVRGVQKRQALLGTVKWLFIIGITLASFYFLEPYMNKMIDTYNQISDMKKSVDNSSLQNILKKIEVKN